MNRAVADAGETALPERPAGMENTTAVNDKLQDPPRALYGWRLHMSVLGLSLALMFSALETTIISTALTTIGMSFNNFAARNCLLFALVWFALFSGLCGGAQNMPLTTLIVFRALQGVGGSGIYAVVFVTIVDIVRVRPVLSPLQGAICSTGDWKWIFLLNVPGAALALAIVFFSLPGGDGHGFSTAHLRRLDVVGAFLSITCAVLLLYGLQTGGDEHPWSDAQVIATLTVGGFCILLFFGWEHWRMRRAAHSPIEPIFPLRLLVSKKVTLLLLAAFFQGCVFYASVINMPQLNQIVRQSSATMAGVRTLPILLPMTFSSFVSGVILSKTLRFAWHMLAAGSVLTALGVGLLIEVPFSSATLARNYGFEAILGVGMGFTMATFLILGRVIVQDRDNVVMIGSVNMMRTMGGCMALSSVQAILHSQLPRRLSFLPDDVVSDLIDAPTTVIKTLSAAEALEVRRRFNDVYRLSFIMVSALGGVAVLMSTLPLFLRKTKSTKRETCVVVGPEMSKA
ncbi:major facilitator superfamily transporter multidrug resistance [Grosmannia clavigera kw1407]|uniref:Major facilitator superfamily transporter multidrug resistance n=1 Tax=Grosmannia clavigera (strain kw1407 / UAMH 11150) TaxID=655863 RepID=F0XUJ5_GROCL|nr:major facilitator superfamily transporter multidrug resistance [Grosmannia clavigera kw1407]EFW98529.1 major facilitator superfamily transporter multidrug resistance [Grosmannia clavigera kw1407]